MKFKTKIEISWHHLRMFILLIYIPCFIQQQQSCEVVWAKTEWMTQSTCKFACIKQTRTSSTTELLYWIDLHIESLWDCEWNVINVIKISDIKTWLFSNHLLIKKHFIWGIGNIVLLIPVLFWIHVCSGKVWSFRM